MSAVLIGYVARSPRHYDTESGLECHDAFEHHTTEAAAVLDVRGRIAEVLLVDIFRLREQARHDEPAAADLPPVRAGVATDARQLAMRFVVATPTNSLSFGRKR